MNAPVCNPYKMPNAQGVHHRDFEINHSGIKFDGFVKSQIGSLRCPLSGVSTPAAKFQELVASSSNSLEFLTPSGSKPFFRKVAMSLPNPTFYETVKFKL